MASGHDVQTKFFYLFIIKFPYNASSDWLKQRALSENRERVDDIKLAFKFLNTKYRRHTDPNGGYDQNEIKRNKH